MSRRAANGAAVPTDRRSRRGQTPNASAEAADTVASEIAELDGKGVDILRVSWARRFKCPAPPIQSADILRRLYAWRLQTETFGNLDAVTQSLLRRAQAAISKGKTPVPDAAHSLRAGTVLVREWRGVTHRVLVRDGCFEHEGKEYRSLSEVARAISGTHWSGPRFFGLDAKSNPKAAASHAGGPAP
jgi:hypothetical protein